VERFTGYLAVGPEDDLVGVEKSSTAVPSRRNSGFIAMWRSSPRVFPEAASITGASVSRVVVGMTVLLW
jgi:hypothetical protein